MLCTKSCRSTIYKNSFTPFLRFKYSSGRPQKSNSGSNDLDEGSDFTVVRNQARNQEKPTQRRNDTQERQQTKSWKWNQSAKVNSVSKTDKETPKFQEKYHPKTEKPQPIQYQKVLDFGTKPPPQKPSYPFATKKIEPKKNPFNKKTTSVDKTSSALLHKIRLLGEVAEVWEYNVNSEESWRRLREVLREVSSLANEVDLRPKDLHIPTPK